MKSRVLEKRIQDLENHRPDYTSRLDHIDYLNDLNHYLSQGWSEVWHDDFITVVRSPRGECRGVYALRIPLEALSPQQRPWV